MSCEFAKKTLDFGSKNPKNPIKGELKGRQCTIDTLICHHYDKPELVKTCPIRRKEQHD
jgi:hypothetical protein